MQSDERRRVFLPVVGQLFEPVFGMSGSRQQAVTEIVGGIVEAVEGMSDEDLDVFRAHLDMLKLGSQVLRSRPFLGFNPSHIMYDWSMVMCGAFVHLTTYGDYMGFDIHTMGSVVNFTSQNPAFVARPQVGMIAPAPSPEYARERQPSPQYIPMVRSPSPVLPWHYH